jgi:alanine racemase
MICQNTYATINLQNLISNCNYVKQTVGDKKILAIVKADAYGHGAVACANALEANGVDYLRWLLWMKRANSAMRESVPKF